MILYVDESGVLDLQTKYFVIVGILAKTKKQNRFIKRTISKAYQLYASNTSNDEIHGNKLKSWQKTNILKKLCSKQNCEIFYLVVNKYELETRLLKKKGECFNYLFGKMVELVLKNIREDIQIFVDNRNVKVSAPKQLEGYIQTKAFASWGFNYHIKIDFKESHDFYGIQASDIIANCVYGYFNYKNNRVN